MTEDLDGVSMTTDQWSSSSSSRSSTPPLSNHHAGNNKLWRMDSGGVSAIPDPPLLNQPGLQGAAGAQEDGPDQTTKLPSSKYKGVVPQPNGRWGAQIYDKHQRLWLGTFDDEESAAKGYDIAAQRLRGWNTYTNFKPLIASSSSSTEMRFLMSRPQAEIINMVRRQTYYPELERSRRNRSNNSPHGRHSKAPPPFPAPRVKLFEKTVTPSDVGKLNRLVVPREHAERHFPPLRGPEGCMFLNFLDANDKVWRFRYSFWNSSRSYVLSRGWTWFIKENHLEAGDVVIFERSSGPDQNQLHINFRPTRVDFHDREVLHELPPRTGPVFRLFGVDISAALAR